MAVIIKDLTNTMDQKNKTLLTAAAKKTLENQGISPRKVEISLVLTNDENIHQLNKEYRDKDCPTDVLSFPMYETIDEIIQDIDRVTEVLLGDVIISLPRAQAQAEEYGHSLERELAFLVVHGVLHLLGFDHINEEERLKMRKEEDRVLQDLKL